MTCKTALALVCGVVLASASLARAQQPDKPVLQPLSNPAATAKVDAPAADPAGKPITVAILDFEAKDPGNSDLGKQIGEVLAAVLSSEPNLKLVERPTLMRALQEHELNLTGLVDTQDAVRVGKLVGAQILITGRAFIIDNKSFITAKIMGTETSLLSGVLVKGEAGARMEGLLVDLADQVAAQMRKSAPSLLPGADRPDALPELRARLAKLKLPVVAVVVLEEHVAAARRTVDPAVETEIKLMLRECGFTVRDVEQNGLADWARGLGQHDVSAWPRDLAGVEVVITGEAFSEFSARIGNLVSCAARAEVNLIAHEDGRILLAQRATTRDVDLSEQIAGKKALQKAGRELGLKVLGHFAATLPQRPPAELAKEEAAQLEAMPRGGLPSN